MRSEITLTLRRFPVVVLDPHSGDSVPRPETAIFTKDQLRAARIVGQSSKELIERFFGRRGYRVLEIGKPDKFTVTLDLDDLLRKHLLEGKADVYG